MMMDLRVITHETYEDNMCYMVSDRYVLNQNVGVLEIFGSLQRNTYEQPKGNNSEIEA